MSILAMKFVQSQDTCYLGILHTNNWKHQVDFVEVYFTDFGARYLRFRYPVRVEGVLIDQLKLYADNISTNRPVQEFFVSLYDETNTDKSYQQLRELWVDDDIDISQYGYERRPMLSAICFDKWYKCLYLLYL